MLAVQQQKRLCRQLFARRVRGTTRLPHDEARSVDRLGILATGVRKSKVYSGVCKGKGKRGFVCREHTSKAFRYGTRSQGISVLPAHPAFIR